MGCGASRAAAQPAALADSTRLHSIEFKKQPTRQRDDEQIKAQRRRQSTHVSEMPALERRSSATALGPTAEKLPKLQRRMSQMSSSTRSMLVGRMKKASSEKRADTLDGRLQKLGLARHEMEGDGNCQFRSFAFGLYGSQEHHKAVREACVAHMKAHEDFFGVFFEEGEFRKYLKGMARNKTWGDELTLRAVVEAYGCVAHVVSSEAANWYLVYEPEETNAPPPGPPGVAAPAAGKRVFLAYKSPIHYDSIVCALRQPSE
eukprot:CAMPEP_0119273302 /NCGR_PEP_ID=MMETSP1329-20130426/9986_1 /TAXON_ID=114041 /ORGANISM="Genus nov. species nov., Strain RCC1024" /LENGTH=259 /DNA_ID=CAMNT_0007273491 /DNA_START=119 /DNA_END=895 /DNA_ORIENTATION=-